MERGWREYSESPTIRDNWNLWWKTSAFTISQHKNLKAWQFTNHIPKGASICRKDNLARNLKCMRKVYGSVYDISPVGYNLPLEYTKLVADCSRNSDEENPKVWICKPVGQSQGRGIFLFKSLSDLCYDSNAVVQRYIKNPLLIGGYKFDLRLYVCVPSYHPLTIYLYKEGLVRFSTDKFSLTDLNNPFCHLTNSSLNKLGPGYSEQKDRIGAGCKWSFKQLRHYFQQAGIKDWLLWQKISALVTLTVLSQSTSVPQTINCFEFYGFDVLVDDKLKPWLLEVNLSPALGNDCDVDPAVKKPLLHDLFDLLGLPVCNTGLSLFTIYTPNDTKQSSVDQSEAEEGCEAEKQWSKKAKTKAATASQSQSSKLGISRAPSRSELIVASAATKWKRKRRTEYLFGPPSKSNLEQQKSMSEQAKRSVIIVQEINNKRHAKPENIAKSVDQNNRDKQGRKCPNTKKREREAPNKAKPSCSGISNSKLKTESPNIRFSSGTDISKAVKTGAVSTENLCGGGGDTEEMKAKKREGSTEEARKPKRVETKISCERVKRPADTVKNILLPFDKSQSAYRGFRGRVRQQPPAMLWGNGRDWREPVQHEGDWGRIYPHNHSYNSKEVPEFEEDYMGNKFTVGDKQIRLVVHHVTKFIKISKQLYSSGLYATEEELNAQLMKNLGLTCEVWLPSK
ncbi:UNVERIFIED_CONTAM: hypothetical protein PYX00_009291 [Menopon gallinae]|uniref:Tubulin polyglutamylase TTLL2 n=1 Tax=Menopon gallinae TaxID=328185 RepID=A0AAW2HAR2_9NEOP